MTARPSADLHQRLDTLFQSGALGARTDRDLLELFLAGPDTRASASFRVLVDRHGPMVLRLCRRLLNNQHEAEDAAQATFLILARRARSIRRKDSVASWLFGVTLRVARKAQARPLRRRKRERSEADMPARSLLTHQEPSNPAPDPLRAEPSLELERLPETLRAPLILCSFEGLTYAGSAAPSSARSPHPRTGPSPSTSPERAPPTSSPTAPTPRFRSRFCGARPSKIPIGPNKSPKAVLTRRPTDETRSPPPPTARSESTTIHQAITG
ncbi:MAG TPA: sigma factor [Isosphaeraceae bacterium]|nr:sigma factor [Isosphaeraceae bacterium]